MIYKYFVNCDFLCIVIDHNESNFDKMVDKDRLDSHKEFLKQIREHLIESKSPQKRWIHLLWNKYDLWQSISDVQRLQFETFRKDEVAKWSQGNFTVNFSSSPHSNNVSADITSFMESLRIWVQK